MAISHNPILNRAVATQMSQSRVDQEFNNLVNNPPMTVEGTVAKVFGSFLVLAVAVATTWFIPAVAQFAFSGFYVLLIGTVIAGMYNSFAKNVNAISVGIYSALEGLFLGSLTYFIDQIYPGLPMLAVVATLGTAGAMFALYATGIIKVTPGFSKVLMFAIIGYAVFGLINLVVAMFNNGASAYNTEFGWLIALVGVGLAAFTLNLDFAQIKQGAEQRLPRELEWRFAFGLISTLIWLYVEILRLLMILQRD